jgi:hypothetical protein
MAQADQTVQNATFPTVRADINNNLAALFSSNSGNTAPTVTVAFQDWIDTSGTDPLWKKRNAANNAWITLGTINGNDILFSGASTLPDQSGNAGEYLKTDGTDATWEPIVSGINGADVFASSGNWTCPTGITKVLVTVIGGGGGGGGGRNINPGSNGSSGGTGGYGTGVLTVTPGTVYTVTVGTGGTGGGFGTSGTAGGTSTFGTISATGGAAGQFAGGVGVVAASGTCSSADATLRRSSVGIAVPFLANGLDYIRERGNGTAAETWAVTSGYSPGARGEGGINISGAVDAGGGVGGAVALLY